VQGAELVAHIEIPLQKVFANLEIFSNMKEQQYYAAISNSNLAEILIA